MPCQDISTANSQDAEYGQQRTEQNPLSRHGNTSLTSVTTCAESGNAPIARTFPRQQETGLEQEMFQFGKNHVGSYSQALELMVSLQLTDFPSVRAAA